VLCVLLRRSGSPDGIGKCTFQPRPQPLPTACPTVVEVTSRGGVSSVRLRLSDSADDAKICRTPTQLRIRIRAESVLAVESPSGWVYDSPVCSRGEWTVRWRSRGESLPERVEGFAMSTVGRTLVLDWEVLFTHGYVWSKRKAEADERRRPTRG
jgi:hypothetical protein